jgi:hypothetical protein
VVVSTFSADDKVRLWHEHTAMVMKQNNRTVFIETLLF